MNTLTDWQPGDAAYEQVGDHHYEAVFVIPSLDQHLALIRDEFGRLREVPMETLVHPDSVIKNTDQPRRMPWPPGMFVQGGADGVVFKRSGGSYRTAFVEAAPGGTFLRGEGATIAEAEERCWEKYQTMQSCPTVVATGQHGPYEPRHYTNGAGFCTACGGWFSRVFTGEQLGQHCHTCGVGTTYGKYSLDAYWDPAASFIGIVNPGPDEDHVWFCEEHAPCREEFAARLAGLAGTDADD